MRAGSLAAGASLVWLSFWGCGARGTSDRSAAAERRQARLERGRYLVENVMACFSCHSDVDWKAPGGPPKPGRKGAGTVFPDANIPFKLVAPNITPDPETGIGRWSAADFLRAMREGRSPAGEPYYPAFPYVSYAKMSEPDLLALKAYLDTVPPVRRPSPPHELSFPFNIRWGLRLWQWAFHDPAPFRPDPTRSEAWNRGAYLVLGPGHCGECHTPRSWYGVLDPTRAFTGGRLGKEVFPNITRDPVKGIGQWTAADLRAFLQIGIKPDGDFVGGDMAKVVSNGTARLPEADREAIVEFLLSLNPR